MIQLWKILSQWIGTRDLSDHFFILLNDEVHNWGCRKAGVQKGQNNRPKRLSPREKTSGVATNVYLRKTLENQKGEGLRILKMRVRELFMHREGISTPRIHHKGWQPLVEWARHDFKIMYFPFLCFSFSFSFWWMARLLCTYIFFKKKLYSSQILLFKFNQFYFLFKIRLIISNYRFRNYMS